MNRLLVLALGLVLSLPIRANEGMWIPLLLNQNYAEMQALGLELSPEELYSINNGSLKDAIVSFGGFCTGEVISDQGLVLTNHHCGYGNIQEHSDTANDYLKNGFWAYEKDQEIPNEGLFVRFLVRVEDVTNQVLAEVDDAMSESERQEKIAAARQKLAKAAEGEDGIEAQVSSFYHGNEYYLFVYRKYEDVRLVGAPPSSIGKYGGDTDNWMWPRHTGDFSLFRIYTGADGSPRAYAEDNVPLKPKHYLPVSLDGVEEGDFTMVMGFPGSTDRYLSSYGVKQAIDKYGPAVVRVRDLKLKVMDKYMKSSEQTRIQYASKYARVSNYWKYYIGQTEQLQSNGVFAKKKAIEDQFRNWVNANADRRERYGEVLKMFKDIYATTDNTVEAQVYAREAGITGPEIALFALRMNRTLRAYFQSEEALEEALDAAETDSAETAARQQFEPRMDAILASLRSSATEFFGDYNRQLDQEMTAKVLALYRQDIPADQQPEILREIADDYKGDFEKYAAKLFDKGLFTSEEATLEFLEEPKQKVLSKDLSVALGEGLYQAYLSANSDDSLQSQLDKAYRLFTEGLRKMNPERNYYPDANSTMRLTYGTVGSYQARDAVDYHYYTTAQGILEKMDNDDPEFVVPEKLQRLIENKDFGRYANAQGELPICFIHNTDITGGNSGSPVINGKGQLIGCAFDGNWEAMSGDIFFEPEIQRTISVDARYILFIIDKYADAQNLIREMTLVVEENSEEMPPVPAKRAVEGAEAM